MSTSTPNHSRTDLRAIADAARVVHEGTTDPILRARAEGVEDVLRFIAADAGTTPELKAATAGRA